MHRGPGSGVAAVTVEVLAPWDELERALVLVRLQHAQNTFTADFCGKPAMGFAHIVRAQIYIRNITLGFVLRLLWDANLSPRDSGII
jgi:hypothetical protein